MSWLDPRLLARLVAVFALAGLTAGCFQPLYGSSNVVANAGLDDKLAAVDVKPIVTPNGTPLARVGVNVRNDLIYDLTGGGYPTSPTHRLDIRLSSNNTQIIVDVTTARSS